MAAEREPISMDTFEAVVSALHDSADTLLPRLAPHWSDLERSE